MKNERALSGAGALAGARNTRVEVELDWDAPEPGIQVHAVKATERCANAGRHLDAWLHAAQYGARFAMEAVNTLPCVVNVVEVAAAPRDTSATIVAAATARAVWSALRHDPSPEILAYIELAVEESRSCAPDVLCPFKLR